MGFFTGCGWYLGPAESMGPVAYVQLYHPLLCFSSGGSGWVWLHVNFEAYPKMLQFANCNLIENFDRRTTSAIKQKLLRGTCSEFFLYLFLFFFFFFFFSKWGWHATPRHAPKSIISCTCTGQHRGVLMILNKIGRTRNTRETLADISCSCCTLKDVPQHFSFCRSQPPTRVSQQKNAKSFSISTCQRTCI